MKKLTIFIAVFILSFTSIYGLAGEGVVFNLNPLSRFIGSFGGDINCPDKPERVPVILIHGNADSSYGWTKEIKDQPSFVDQLKTAGYTNCDIYAVSYLSVREQLSPSDNYHEIKKMLFIKDFIETTLKKTGQQKVDIVTHSLGVTLTLEVLHRYNLFESVRKFVAIAGALHGIENCAQPSLIRPTPLTCASIINKKENEFGFWPDNMYGISNPRMGTGPESFASFPEKHKSTTFYSISAGLSDEIICAGQQGNDEATCQKSSYFGSCKKHETCNIGSQLLIGKAPTGLFPITAKSLGGDIADGIGHMRARGLSGGIVATMLETSCKGIQCCLGYQNSCTERSNYLK